MSLARAISPVITFIEEPHGYLVDGEPKRFWSQIAIDAGLADPVPDTPWVINAKHRGRQIHQAAAMIVSGVPFDPQELAEESLPYVQAFLDCWGRHGVPRAHAEIPLYCADLDFCTTPDIRTVTTIHEIKTTDRPSRTWGLQLAAQVLATGHHLLGRSVFWLRPKLKTRSYEVLEPPDRRVFSEFDFDVVREACAGLYDGPAITAWKGLSR